MRRNHISIVLFAAAAACVAMPSSAQPRPDFLPVGRAAPPPFGLVELCARSPQDCPVAGEASAPVSAAGFWRIAFSGGQQARGRASEPATVPLTEGLKSQLQAVNRAVNRSIRPLAERGDEDVWTLPLAEGRADGDCEDFVLEKRRALIGLGVPAEVLSIALVRTSARQEHAVLLISAEGGELVLDSKTPWIQHWRKTNYVWLKRQTFQDQSQWERLSPS